MTLGPVIALLPFAEQAPRMVRQRAETFGRVPMFYYLLHIPLIHALALLAWYLRDGATHAERFVDGALRFHPAGSAMGAWAFVRGMAPGRCDPLPAVPLVCAGEGGAPGRLAAICVGGIAAGAGC